MRFRLLPRIFISQIICAILIANALAEPLERVDPMTLTGKIMCGYQGWFTCEGDGMNLGWTHWARDRGKQFGPGNVTIDLWPEVSEMDEDELFETGFKFANSEPAKVFSSANRKTVLRHFKWMQEYGIDGVFLQRFANGLTSGELLNQKNTVLKHVREGAGQFGRAYAVMYDLSGLQKGQTSLVIDDWKELQKVDPVTKDPMYLHHEGKPVVAVWGVGFSDNRPYTLEECANLIAFLKGERCAVMLGVPSYWREGNRDSVGGDELHGILKMADILSPWTVGRYQTPEQATKHGEQVWKSDVEWCAGENIDFFPVVYPGFSWFNLHGGDLNSIPRRKGEFLWSQIAAAKRAGSEMIYVAMFDEVDEGTAIFKCSNHPPVGEGVSFIDYEGMESDFYLRLTGRGGQLLRGEIPLTETVP